jgi:hypothetical protein
MKTIDPETYVTKTELAAILAELCLLDTELEHTGLRILAACVTRGGNFLDFRGRDVSTIEANTVDVSPDVRTYVVSQRTRDAIRQRLGRLIEKLKTPVAAEPAKTDAPVKNRLDAALAAKA